MSTKKLNIGCFGFFWILGLMFFSAAELAALYWLNPVWVDSNAYWRGEIYSAEATFSFLSEEDSADWAEASPDLDANPETRVVLWQEFAKTAQYTTSSGAKIETIEGASFSFAPGSVRESCEIEVIPIVEIPAEMANIKAVTVIGPLHELRIGGADHYSFDSDVSVTFRYDPATIPDEWRPGRIAVGTWEDDKWVVVDSQSDTASGSISADLEHASVVGVIWIGAASALAAMQFTQTGQGLQAVMKSYLDKEYDTKNFRIHYSDSSYNAVPTDEDYPLTRGRSGNGVPLFVQDVGMYLEDAMAGLGELGFPGTPGLVFRQEVMLTPGKNFGSTNLGGAIMLDNDFRIEGEFPADFEYRLHVTCVHELIHVIQDDFFNSLNGAKARWWIEATAEFIANRFLQMRGHELTNKNYYISDEPTLLETPWDDSTALQPYAWARFLNWLEEEQGVDSIGLVGAVNGNASLAAINQELRNNNHDSLGNLYMDFAEDLHHDNFWTLEYANAEALEQRLKARTVFKILSRPNQKGAAVLYPYARTQFAQNHFSSSYVNFRALSIPEDARAKLVVHFPNSGATHGDDFALVGGMNGGEIPLQGSPSILTPVELGSTRNGAFWVSKPLSLDGGNDGYSNQVSLIVGNTSLSKDGPGQVVRRWLLMPPQLVVYSRKENSNEYEVTWQESVLKELCKHQEFAGYNVYRRSSDERKFPEAALNRAPVTATHFLDTPPDQGEYVYTVTVVDSLGNESLTAKATNSDPFVGEWDGKFILVKGDLLGPLQGWFGEDSRARAKTYRNEINLAETAEERAELQAAHDEIVAKDKKFTDAVEKGVGEISAILRLGVPATFVVSKRDGKYFAHFTKFYFQEVEEGANPEEARFELELRGAITIAPKGLPEEMKFVELPLHRQDQINHVWKISIPTEKGELNYAVRLDFKRKQDQGSPDE